MTDPGNRILAVSRPEAIASDMTELAAAPVANVDDAMNRLFAMDSGIRPLNRHRVGGVAKTVQVPDGDNLFVHAAMDMLAEGDVLVIKGGTRTDRALLGELMLNYLATKKIQGVIVDGLVRDLDYIREDCPFAVYARGSSPNGPYKNGPGEINFPLACGNVVVSPGDIILGDEDGVVVVPRDDIARTAKAVAQIQAHEARTIDGIRQNGRFERPWLQDRLTDLGTSRIDIQRTS